ncbi:MAG: hypothetical protein WC087_04140 [Candidatus Paceibacterota bacterium]
MNPIDFQQHKENIITALEARGFRMRTDGLMNPEFILIDGFVNQPIYNQLSNNVVIGGPTIPMVVIAHTQTAELKFFPAKALITISI